MDILFIVFQMTTPDAGGRARCKSPNVEMASGFPHHLVNRNHHPTEGYSSFFDVMRYDSPERENILA